eukprot:1805940-Pleurochrysis_carterae.AAC.1
MARLSMNLHARWRGPDPRPNFDRPPRAKIFRGVGRSRARLGRSSENMPPVAKCAYCSIGTNFYKEGTGTAYIPLSAGYVFTRYKDQRRAYTNS